LIENSVNNRTTCDETIYSQLRGRQVKIKGYPLNDCYYFYSITLPAKEELLDELRQELNKRKEVWSIVRKKASTAFQDLKVQLWLERLTDNE
jgi:hypothetical protein